MTSISSSQGVQANWKAAAADGRVTEQEANTIVAAAKLNAVSSTELEEAAMLLYDTQRALSEHGNSGGAVGSVLDVLTGGGSPGDAVESGVNNAVSGARLREQAESAQKLDHKLQAARAQQGLFTNLKADLSDWLKGVFG